MYTVATSSDGKNTEGIGALAQYQLMCIGLAKLHELDYTFSPFVGLQHYQYFNVTQERFCQDVNNLFNFDAAPLPTEQTRYLSPVELMREGQEKLEGLFPTLSKQNLYLEDSKKYFKQDEVNVAIHVRVYTQTDCCTASSREYFNANGNLDHKAYYANIMSTLKKAYGGRKVVFHVYSQGTPKDFEFFFDLDPNVILHIEEYPTVSLYHMATSDVLVMANSSLSYVAHLYGKCFTIARDSFYHKLYEKTSVRADQTGSFDVERLKTYAE